MRTPASVNATPANINIAGMSELLMSSLKTTGFFLWSNVFLKPKSIPSLSNLTRGVNTLLRNMISQMFNAIAAVTGQGQNPNTTSAQWASSLYGYSGGSRAGGGGSCSAHLPRTKPASMHSVTYLIHRIKTRPSCFFKVFAMTTPMMTPSYSYTIPGQQQAMTTPQSWFNTPLF